MAGTIEEAIRDIEYALSVDFKAGMIRELNRILQELSDAGYDAGREMGYASGYESGFKDGKESGLEE